MTLGFVSLSQNGYHLRMVTIKWQMSVGKDLKRGALTVGGQVNCYSNFGISEDIP